MDTTCGSWRVNAVRWVGGRGGTGWEWGSWFMPSLSGGRDIWVCVCLGLLFGMMPGRRFFSVSWTLSPDHLFGHL